MARKKKSEYEIISINDVIDKVGNMLHGADETKRKIWNSFKSYYKNKTKSNALDYYETFDEFLTDYGSIATTSNEDIFDSYIVFSVKNLLLKVIQNLHVVIDSLSNNQEELDYKTTFVIFDKMVAQMNSLMGLYNKVVSKMDKQNEQGGDEGPIFEIDTVK